MSFDGTSKAKRPPTYEEMIELWWCYQRGALSEGKPSGAGSTGEPNPPSQAMRDAAAIVDAAIMSLWRKPTPYMRSVLSRYLSTRAQHGALASYRLTADELRPMEAAIRSEVMRVWEERNRQAQELQEGADR